LAILTSNVAICAEINDRAIVFQNLVKTVIVTIVGLAPGVDVMITIFCDFSQF
jgi:hypothetical protein